jgi:hypothetical protein
VRKESSVEPRDGGTLRVLRSLDDRLQGFEVP